MRSRHCERSEAIHLAAQRKNGLLRRARNDAKSSRSFTTPRRDAPELCMKLPPNRGRGECRMPVAPAGSCALWIGRTHTSKRVHRNRPAFPHGMVLTVSFVLLVTGLVCHRRLRIKVLSKPGWADLNSANLTPASGRQDHTRLRSDAVGVSFPERGRRRCAI